MMQGKLTDNLLPWLIGVPVSAVIINLLSL